MSRNEDRIGTDVSKQADAPMEAHSSLSWVTGTDIVELPTRGLFYPEEHALHNEETVEIQEMSTDQEGILTNKSFLKKGTAIDKMIQSILPHGINVKELFSGDKNAIIMAARISGYGKMYKAKVRCQFCGEMSEVEFDLTELKPNFGILDVKDALISLEEGTFAFQIPDTNFNVTCKLTNGHDEEYLVKLAQGKKKNKLKEEALFDQMSQVIQEVNTVTDRGKLSAFIRKMPAKHALSFRKIYADMVPSLNMNQEMECSECEAKFKTDIPLQQEFFWPQQ